MNRRLPSWASGSIILACVLVAMYIVGYVTPRSGAGAGPLTGLEAPGLEGNQADGKVFKLTDWKGKVVLVNFWATWCGPCRMEIPQLVAMQKKFKDRGFTVVGVSMDDSLEQAAEFARTEKMDYPIFLGTQDLKDAWGGVRSIPATFLIDRNGKIAMELPGYDPEFNLAKEVEKYL